MKTISMTWPQYKRGEATINGNPHYFYYYEAQILSLLLMRRGELVRLVDIAANIGRSIDFTLFMLRLLRSKTGVLRHQNGYGWLIKKERAGE